MTITTSSVRLIDAVAVLLWTLTIAITVIDISTNHKYFPIGVSGVCATLSLGVTQIATITWLVHKMDIDRARRTIDELTSRRDGYNSGNGM